MSTQNAVRRAVRASGFVLFACATLLGTGRPAHAEYPSLPDSATLLDRAQIEDLMQSYMRRVDTGDADAVLDLFTDDLMVDINGKRVEGRKAVREFFKGMAPPPGVQQGTFHLLLSDVRIVIDSASCTVTGPHHERVCTKARNHAVWTGIKSASVDATPQLVEQGRYDEDFVKLNGRWYIKNHTVSSDGGMPDLFKAGYQPHVSPLSPAD